MMDFDVIQLLLFVVLEGVTAERKLLFKGVILWLIRDKIVVAITVFQVIRSSDSSK